MSVLFVALPVALALGSLAVWGFVWATRGGQFDDPGNSSLAHPGRRPAQQESSGQALRRYAHDQSLRWSTDIERLSDLIKNCSKSTFCLTQTQRANTLQSELFCAQFDADGPVKQRVFAEFR